MASADPLKALMRSHADGDGERLYAQGVARSGRRHAPEGDKA